MWHNETGKDLDAVYLRYSMLWMPTNQNPRRSSSLPIYMDVNLTVGGTNTFDAPPGKLTKTYEFTLPVGGRLLGVGGHLHDYGSMVQLEDAESGQDAGPVVAKRDSAGRVLKVSRKLFGVSGEGLKLEAGHRYRVVGTYDNPTQKASPGVMAHMVGLFVPDDLSKWPKVDTSIRPCGRISRRSRSRGTATPALVARTCTTAAPTGNDEPRGQKPPEPR